MSSVFETPEFKAQAAEFDAVGELCQLWRTQPGIVDDDYPSWRHRYEGAIRRTVQAALANKAAVAEPVPSPVVAGEAETALVAEIFAELARARAKFPGKNVTFAALVEEVGELATASFEESSDRVRKEAVQVAVMAIRMILDGDTYFDPWRREKGLDHLSPIDRAAELTRVLPAPLDALDVRYLRELLLAQKDNGTCGDGAFEARQQRAWNGRLDRILAHVDLLDPAA